MDSSWRGWLLRRTQRLRAVRYVVVCFKVSFFSGLESVAGWLKVTPMLARPNWQLDSGACKNGKGRGTRKKGTELVVGLQCHTGQVRGQGQGRRDFQDQSTISSGTQKTNLDSNALCD